MGSSPARIEAILDCIADAMTEVGLTMMRNMTHHEFEQVGYLMLREWQTGA